jgi:hypothetical protein
MEKLLGKLEKPLWRKSKLLSNVAVVYLTQAV